MKRLLIAVVIIFLFFTQAFAHRAYYKNYIRAKTANRATIVKIDQEYFLQFSKWDPETGEPMAVESIKISLIELQDQKTALQAEVAAINAILSDVAAIP